MNLKIIFFDSSCNEVGTHYTTTGSLDVISFPVKDAFALKVVVEAGC